MLTAIVMYFQFKLQVEKFFSSNNLLQHGLGRRACSFYEVSQCSRGTAVVARSGFGMWRDGSSRPRNRSYLTSVSCTYKAHCRVLPI